MRRVYITEEFPILGLFVSIFILFIVCYFSYLIVFKGLLPSTKKEWSSVSTDKRFAFMAKAILKFICAIAVAALLIFLVIRFLIIPEFMLSR